MSDTYFIYIACSILSFIPALVLHEVAHGFAAYKLGDPTAKAAGRLSLNPLKHIDPFGTVILPAALMLLGWPVFGYAKPVPYNPTFFKDIRKGDFIVGIAGPLANFVMALVGAGVAWAILLSTNYTVPGEFLQIILLMYLPVFVLINLYLMFFNLLPIPPLDGSSIFALIVPKKHLRKYYSVQQYAMPVLMIALVVLPYVFNVNPFSWYLDFTAGNVANLIFPLRLS